MPEVLDFEIGGQNKKGKQIRHSTERDFLVKDDQLHATAGSIFLSARPAGPSRLRPAGAGR